MADLLDTITTVKDDTGRVPWPPQADATRIKRQVDWQTLVRNNPVELVGTWRDQLGKLAEKLAPGSHPLYPAPKLAAGIMASFLFGEQCALTTPDDDATQEAIDTWRDDTNLDLTLREAVRTQATQGEVYLRPVWDADLSEWVQLVAEPGRRVLPRWQHRRLVEAVIYSEVHDATTDIYYRLFEHHVAGRITTVAYRGTHDTVGQQVDLGVVDRWADIPETVDTGVDQLTLVHVPFDRDAEDEHGIGLFEGTEGLVFGIHRLYLQEQHDAEMAKRRIALPTSYLRRDQQNRPLWDREDDIFELDDAAAGVVGNENAITPIEWKDDLVMRERIQGRLRDFFLACGIAPQTLGEEAGSAESGTARRLAQSLTVQTVGRTAGYWVAALQEAIPLALTLSRIHLAAQVPLDPTRPVVELQDGFVNDPREQAQVLAMLDTAEAISTEQKVRQLHPEWDDDEVTAEVEAISEGTAVPAVMPPPATPFGPPAEADEEPAEGP